MILKGVSRINTPRPLGEKCCFLFLHQSVPFIRLLACLQFDFVWLMNTHEHSWKISSVWEALWRNCDATDVFCSSVIM